MAATVVELLGLFQLATQQENKRHNQAAKQERNAPAPFTDGALFQHRVEDKAHRRRHHNRDLLTARLPAGVKALAAWCGDLCQIDRHAAQLCTGGEALQQPTDQHQQRRPQANTLVRGDQYDHKGACRHDGERDDQPFTTTDLIDVRAQHYRANRAHQEPCAKYGKGHHQ